jgi:hypothetical protein
MKIGTFSSDSLVKLVLGAAALGLLVYAARKVATATGDALTQAQALAVGAVQYVNPADSGNIVNRGVTKIGDMAVSDTGPGRNADGSWTLGGFLYDINPFEDHYKN